MSELHPALEAVRVATVGTIFDGDLWLVGGAVRDELIGLPQKNDFDLVTRGSSADLAQRIFDQGLSSIPPVTYERFGTAMVRIQDVDIELVTARRESYDESSRKPTVEPATYLEDARRRDFTVNTLMRNLHSGELRDPLGCGLDDLQSRVLRTPLDPLTTFVDDPLRMLRAVRFRWKLGFHSASGLDDAIRESRGRLRIVSYERIRDELIKMLGQVSAPDALQDLMQLGLLETFAPEFLPMVGCEQGKYHHLDVWNHTLLVLKNTGSDDLLLSLSAIFHDIGKPSTRHVDSDGNTRFFTHEVIGAEMTREVLRRLKFSSKDVELVASLVKNHMRLGTSPSFTPAAARRVLRDMGDQTDRLLKLVEADSTALRPGVKSLDIERIREQIETVQEKTPASTLVCPLSGEEVMSIAGIPPGPEVGRLKGAIIDKILEGSLAPGDRDGAKAVLLELQAS